MRSRHRLMSLATCWLGMVATAALAATPAPVPVEGTDYRLVAQAQRTLTPDKIEVVEFFSYACPHCAVFYPLVAQWLTRQGKDVSFRRVPVGFNRAEWINLQRAFYALQTSGDFDKLDGPLFHAIHEEHQRLFDQGSIAEWVGKNGGNPEKFAGAYGSFGVNNQTVQADKMAEDYGIDSVPTIAIDGKYVAMADPAKGEAQYLAELLGHADMLIAKARAERPATRPPANATKPIRK